ncbi:hypothetical protein [Streptomyces sp. NPDC088400]|uniref:hypothetical protein n=1 Tax=Streptomyces sp. NPDC088400 TaxID=3365861 RepID=UPI00381ED73D
MTTAYGTDGWTAAVRERLGLGRLLPLGGSADGAWLAERAAVTQLRCATAGMPGAVLGTLRIAPADLTGPDDQNSPDERDRSDDRDRTERQTAHERPSTPPPLPPPGALPPGPLRIDGEFTAVSSEPLPTVAELLRGALFTCATDQLGLRVEEIDLHVTGLLDTPGESPAPAGPAGGGTTAGASEPNSREPDSPGPGAPKPETPKSAALEGESARLAASVPGVARLTRTLGGATADTPEHLRVELATAAGHRPLDVARAVRQKLMAELPGGPSVTVLVTAVDVAP